MSAKKEKQSKKLKTQSSAKAKPSEKIFEMREKQDKQPEENKKKELEEAKKENLYLRAEFENFKKRSLEARQAFQKYEGERLLVLLADEVFDDWDRALSLAGDQKSFDELYKGLQMIQKKLNTVLKNYGVEVVDPTGEPFNPDFQEAMGEIDSKTVRPGHVVSAFRKAYKLNDKFVRTAQVILSKKNKEEETEEQD